MGHIQHCRAVTSFLLRFLSPTRGTEGVVKTIEKAWLEVELSLRGKSDANECNESSLSNCRVQLALSTKRDGMIRKSIMVQRYETLSRHTIRLSPNTYILTALLYKSIHQNLPA